MHRGLCHYSINIVNTRFSTAGRECRPREQEQPWEHSRQRRDHKELLTENVMRLFPAMRVTPLFHLSSSSPIPYRLQASQAPLHSATQESHTALESTYPRSTSDTTWFQESLLIQQISWAVFDQGVCVLGWPQVTSASVLHNRKALVSCGNKAERLCL